MANTKKTETKPKTRRVLDVTDKSTGVVTRMTYQKFYSYFGHGQRYARHSQMVTDILWGRNANYSAVEVEEIVPDKAAVKAAALETPIALAVMPLKEDAMNRAEEAAREMAAKAAEELKQAGNDLNKAAPYPSSLNYKTRADYVQGKAKYAFFRSITKSRTSTTRPGQPDFADVMPALVEKFVLRCREDAAFQYEAYVIKLSKKIGKVIEAHLEGGHVWSYSYLHVTLVSGEAQCWKTQMILNRSVYGKLFNQFPTRKVKV